MGNTIYKTKEEWAEVSGTEELINEWEAENELNLPDDYKKFMVKYNGGILYPLIFNHNIPLELWPSGEELLYLDSLHPWDYGALLWRDESQSYPRPKNTLEIGSDPGGIGVILSLQAQSYGQIFLNLSFAVPGDGEPKLRNYHLANSFREFVFEKLYETSDREGYDYWYSSDAEKNAKKVEF